MSIPATSFSFFFLSFPLWLLETLGLLVACSLRRERERERTTDERRCVLSMRHATLTILSSGFLHLLDRAYIYIL